MEGSKNYKEDSKEDVEESHEIKVVNWLVLKILSIRAAVMILSLSSMIQHESDALSYQNYQKLIGF